MSSAYLGLSAEPARCCRYFLSGFSSDATAAPNTLRQMKRLVRAAVADQEFVYFVRQLIAGVPARDEMAQVNQLRAWLATHFQFVRDPRSREDVRDPRFLVSKIVKDWKALGDCDDAATLSAALAAAIGFPARFVAVAFGTDPRFRHVYTIVTARDVNGFAVDREMDVTRTAGRPLPKVTRAIALTV